MNDNISTDFYDIRAQLFVVNHATLNIKIDLKSHLLKGLGPSENLDAADENLDNKY